MFELSQKLHRVGFSQGAFSEAFAAVVNQQRAARADLQNFECFFEVCTDAVWASLVGPDAFNAKFVTMMVHMENLGLRNPSEHTFAAMAALLLISCHRSGVDRAAITNDLLQTYLELTKNLWRSKFHSRRRTQPPEFIDVLPPTAAEVQRRFPQVYAVAFRELAPTPPQIPSLEIQTVQGMMKLRGAGSCRKRQFADCAQIAAPPMQNPLALPWFGAAQPSVPMPKPLQQLAVAEAPAQLALPAPLALQAVPEVPKCSGGWQNPAVMALRAHAAAGTIQPQQSQAVLPEAKVEAKVIPVDSEKVIAVDSDSEGGLDGPAAANPRAATALRKPNATAQKTREVSNCSRTPSQAAMTMLAAVRARSSSGWSARDDKSKKTKAAGVAAADAAEARAAAGTTATKGDKGNKKGGKGANGVKKGDKGDKKGDAAAAAADSCSGLSKPRFEVTECRSIVQGVQTNAFSQQSSAAAADGKGGRRLPV